MSYYKDTPIGKSALEQRVLDLELVVADLLKRIEEIQYPIVVDYKPKVNNPFENQLIEPRRFQCSNCGQWHSGLHSCFPVYAPVGGAGLGSINTQF